MIGVVLFLTAAAASAVTSTTREAVASPHTTMRELGRELHAPIPLAEEHEQRRSFTPKINSIAANMVVRAESIVTKPSIPAPTITAGFAASHDLGRSPSDAAGAVSSKYLLHVSNASVVAQDRSGTVLSSITLASFWHAPAYLDGELYDSRVLYDAVADRWVICTLYDVNLLKSTLLIAVSDGGNPSLGWHRYRFIVDPTDVRGADFTRMAMTRDSIAITANMFSPNSDGVDLYTIRKSDAYAAATTLPVSQLHVNGFDFVPVDGREDAQLLLLEQSSTADLVIWAYSCCSLHLAANPLAPTTNLITGVFVPIGRQLGSSLRLDCGNTFIHNAVMKNGTLWVASEVYRDSPARSAVLWWRIVLGNLIFALPPRVDTGLIDDPTGATNYAYPSVAANKLGAVLIAYSVFNASYYPSAGYSYIDPFNSLSTPAVLKAGNAPAVFSRWADFSTTVVDANDIDFWTTQTYSPLLSSGGVWAVWWSRIEMPVPARGRAVRR